jgi:hypothetical protein
MLTSKALPLNNSIFRPEMDRYHTPVHFILPQPTINSRRRGQSFFLPRMFKSISVALHASRLSKGA